MSAGDQYYVNSGGYSTTAAGSITINDNASNGTVWVSNPSYDGAGNIHEHSHGGSAWTYDYINLEELFKHIPGVSGWTKVADMHELQGNIESLVSHTDGYIYGKPIYTETLNDDRIKNFPVREIWGKPYYDISKILWKDIYA